MATKKASKKATRKASKKATKKTAKKATKKAAKKVPAKKAKKAAKKAPAKKKAARKAFAAKPLGVTPPLGMAAAGKSSVIQGCILSVFQQEGLNINADSKIDWGKFTDDDVLVALGNGIRDCIASNGFECDGLAPEFLALRDAGKVTPVSTLVNIISLLVTP
jgi:hypothetical protein